VVLRLPVRAPFDAAGVLGFLAARAVDGVEEADPHGYARTLRLAHGTATARLRPANGHLECALALSDMRDMGSAVARLRRLFDLDADPVAVDAVLGADPALAPSVAATPGIRVPGTVDGAETLVRALLGQQVTVAAARTAATRLAAALGERLPAPDGALTTLFPTAAAIAEHGASVLTGPARRVESVISVCAAVASGDLDPHVGADSADLCARLRALPGIGPWTAGYVVTRVLGAPDILLLEDIALRKGAAALGLGSTPDALAAAGARWQPWRSYAGMHLWRAAARPLRQQVS
jgi:AraC family transcriptional regulator, regulatory protein of adaptative response / DNA-3-methyladenine glycosylase II